MNDRWHTMYPSVNLKLLINSQYRMPKRKCENNLLRYIRVVIVTVLFGNCTLYYILIVLMWVKSAKACGSNCGSGQWIQEGPCRVRRSMPTGGEVPEAGDQQAAGLGPGFHSVPNRWISSQTVYFYPHPSCLAKKLYTRIFIKIHKKAGHVAFKVNK